MSHSAPFTGLLLYQVHCHSKEEVNKGESGTKSKDKICMQRGWQKMAAKLDAKKIAVGLLDRSSTGNKVFQSIIQQDQKHFAAKLQNCCWHKEVGLLEPKLTEMD